MPAAASFLQAANSSSNLTTYTLSSQSFGAEDAGRHIVVVVHLQSATTTVTIATVTIGGVSASIPVQRTHSGPGSGFGSVSGIAIAAVPTGASGDVVVTASNASARCAIEMYRLVDINSATPTDTDSSIADDPTVNLDIPADGVAIGGSQITTTATCSWSGITEDSEQTTESTMRSSSAHDEFVSAQTGLAITAAWSAGAAGNNPIGVFASWAPAGGGETAVPVLDQGMLTGGLSTLGGGMI